LESFTRPRAELLSSRTVTSPETGSQLQSELKTIMQYNLLKEELKKFYCAVPEENMTGCQKKEKRFKWV
jgi:hypothetical protein